MHRAAPWTTIAALGLTVCAAAGPEWPETSIPVEAGSLPETAQKPLGSGQLKKINGQLLPASGLLGGAPGDFQDMYLIRIVDPVGFRASTLGAPAGSGADFNTQLFLFSVFEVGVLANDDDLLSGTLLSAITSPATDGTGATIPGAGLYYLAITGFNSDPVSIPGPIFDQVTSTEISGPDGFGGSGLIVGWVPPTGARGTYSIDLTGVEFVDCDGDLDLDDVVGFSDLTLLLAAWGPCPAVPPCPADLDFDFQVGFSDLTTLLANWGACGPPV